MSETPNETRLFFWTVKKSDPLPNEVAKELKDDARYYLGLDLAYLAAVSALVSLLKIRPTQIPGLLSPIYFDPAVGNSE